MGVTLTVVAEGDSVVAVTRNPEAVDIPETIDPEAHGAADSSPDTGVEPAADGPS
jgi:hypothetical protein